MSFLINPYSFSSAPTDPDFGDVVLLAGFNGTDGQSSGYSAETGQVYTFNANQTLDSEQVQFADTALKNAGAGGNGSFPSSSTWDLSAANSDEFTIEFWYYFPNLLSTTSMLNANWNTDGWLLRSDGDQIQFFWNVSSGAGGAGFHKASPGFTSPGWNHIALTKNSSGKMRYHIQGSMVHSATPADSTFETTTGPLLVHAQSGHYMQEVRITKGTCRYDTDSSISVPTERFPRS